MEIRILNANPLFDYKHACLITKGKNVEKVTTPEDELKFWIRHICTEHSTLRFITFTITDCIPKSCVMQIIRATKDNPQPEVQSSRPDWCGKERSSNPYQEIYTEIKYTPGAFLAMCRQRLCLKTEAKTRAVINNWVDQMRNNDNPLIKALRFCAMAQCEYHGNVCTELEPCGKCKNQMWKMIYDNFGID